MSLPAWGVWIEIAFFSTGRRATQSLPAWGVWIEIVLQNEANERCIWSLPAWGVWIEIASLMCGVQRKESLPAWGVWIEITLSSSLIIVSVCHSPHGECGLKFDASADDTVLFFVTPRMGSVD